MIDIGANLAHDSFEPDRAQVLDRAWDAGLTAVVITGSSMESSRAASKLVQCAPGKLFSTAGLHPHHAHEWNSECAQQIRTLANAPGLVSLGECGLDYFRNFSSPTDQRTAFVAQLELAVELKKPVFLHQRDAHSDFQAILREFRSHLVQACVHCFTDTQAAAEDYLNLDCHIGITGWICDERRGKNLLDVVRIIPATRLMIETDAPYLLPRNLPKEQRPANARRNEPAFLPWVAKAIAQARDEASEHIASQTTTNARRFFGI